MSEANPAGRTPASRSSTSAWPAPPLTAARSRNRAPSSAPPRTWPRSKRGAQVDHRCDLFSLGCVLYRMTTGEQPFRGSDTLSTLMSLANDEPTPPMMVNFDVPAEFSDLIMKLLAKSPEARASTAREVADELDRLARGESGGGPEADAASVAGKHRAQADAGSVGHGATVRKRGQRPVLFGIGVAAALLLTASGLAGVLMMRITTPEGTLVIDSEDPDAQIIVKGNEVQILTGKKHYELKLKPGAFDLTLKGGKEQLTLESNRVTLGKGDEKKIRVFIRNAGAKEEPPDNHNEPKAFVALLQREDIKKELDISAAQIEKLRGILNGTVMEAVATLLNDKQMKRFRELAHRVPKDGKFEVIPEGKADDPKKDNHDDPGALVALLQRKDVQQELDLSHAQIEKLAGILDGAVMRAAATVLNDTQMKRFREVVARPKVP